MEKGVELFWANHVWLEAGQEIRAHSHTWYTLQYHLAGTATFTVDGRIMNLSPGSCSLIPANAVHSMAPLTERMESYEMKLMVRDPFLLEHLRETPAPMEDSGILRPMLAYVAENWESGDERNRSNIETILTTILMRFFIERLHYEDRDSSYILTERYNQLTRAILVWVEKNYLQKFSLDDLGGALNYNKNYLSSVFSENTGVSILDYTNFLRLRKAVIFFAYYSSDVLTACEGAGFRNPSYFSRTFKTLVGIPPRSFCRAFSGIPEQERTEYFRKEPVLSYRPCTMEDAFRSLRHIGETAMKLQNKKNGSL